MSSVRALLVAALAAAAFLSACSVEKPTLTLYSGRGKALIEPILAKFTEETGIKVDVKYAGTTQLAITLMEEGAQSPADVFWASDIGGLGAVTAAGLLQELDADLYEGLDPRFVGAERTWVATSNRARVLAYSTARADAAALPASVFDLTQSRYAKRVGWAPTNGTFQSFLSAMVKTHGRDAAKAWLEGMKANGAVAYANNNAIIQAIDAGEIDFGITNHYYLLRARQANAAIPIEQTFFAPGDIGNMLNLAGLGILKTSKHKQAAERLIAYLLTESSQEFFATTTFEYPVKPIGDAQLAVDSLRAYSPAVSLEDVPDLEATLALLREVELL
jgi:iron(III) transport system substrate-binding protein